MTDAKSSPYIVRAADITAKAERHKHPWNPNALLEGTTISRIGGLKRVGVSIATIPPGKESFVDHAHWAEEEWLYILSGRAVARIDGEEFEVGPGDFVAFPTPSPAHQLLNPFAEEVRYLMGGEIRDAEIVDYPTLGRRMVRANGVMQLHSLADGKPFEFGPTRVDE